jgi:hypothetical protein
MTYDRYSVGIIQAVALFLAALGCLLLIGAVGGRAGLAGFGLVLLATAAIGFAVVLAVRKGSNLVHPQMSKPGESRPEIRAAHDAERARPAQVRIRRVS